MKNKILIITQKVSRDDLALGFFHDWITEFSEYFKIKVICLEKGEFDLSSVDVYSLGKENKPNKIKYIFRFYKHIWNLRKDYDSVFVHMNQEYVLLGGLFWRLMGKKIYMWRNYHYGNFWTEMAIRLSHKVLCTSTSSFTAGRKKTVLMPVGVNKKIFEPKEGLRQGKTILSFGRISSDKRLEVFIESLVLLKRKNQDFKAKIYGNELPIGLGYLDKLKGMVEKGDIGDAVEFHPGVPNRQAVEIYSSNEIFVNLSPSGMYDKMIFEACACGCLVVASSKDWSKKAGKELSFDGTSEGLVEALTRLLNSDEVTKKLLVERCDKLAKEQSLSQLAFRLNVLIN